MSRLMYRIIALTFLLSMCDAIMTIIHVENQVAEEANPLMSFFLGIHPVVFMLAKTILMMACLLWLWRSRKYSLSQYAACGAMILYAGIVGYHIHAFMYLL